MSISQVGTKIKMSSGNFHSLPRGWVTGYVVNIPPGTPLRNAESVAMKELPGDAAVVATSTSQPDCVGQELDSAIVGEALSQLGANAKYIAVIYESGQGHQAAFDPTNVNTHEYIGEGYVSVGRFDLARVELAKVAASCGGTDCVQYEALAKAIETGNIQ